jgi:hypothetical protein
VPCCLACLVICGCHASRFCWFLSMSSVDLPGGCAVHVSSCAFVVRVAGGFTTFPASKHTLFSNSKSIGWLYIWFTDMFVAMSL